MEYLTAFMAANKDCEYFNGLMFWDDYYKNLLDVNRYAAKLEREELLEKHVEQDRKLKKALKRSSKFIRTMKFQNPKMKQNKRY